MDTIVYVLIAALVFCFTLLPTIAGAIEGIIDGFCERHYMKKQQDEIEWKKQYYNKRNMINY